MHIRTRVLMSATIGLCVLAGAAAVVLFDGGGRDAETVSIDASDARLVALGEGVYAEHCATCHGANLEGEADWRQRKPNGRLPAPPHDRTGHTWHHPDPVLFALTKYGPAALAPGDYESDMPAYEDTLSDDRIIAVLAYIKSRWPADIRSQHDTINAKIYPRRN